MMEKEPKKVYEPPTATIAEFEPHDSIASSSNYGSDTICTEELFG